MKKVTIDMEKYESLMLCTDILRKGFAYTYTKQFSEVICMKPEIRKIVMRSALLFGMVAVSVCGMQLAAYRSAQKSPDAVSVSAAQMPVIVLDAGHGEST